MSTNNKNPSNSSSSGVDSLLTLHGKELQTGQEIRFVLVKGPSTVLANDPVNSKAPKESFPLIAKFSESVVKPDLSRMPWKTARLYQQDIPKAQDDSDEEQDSSSQQPKKRWRARNPKDVGRQWILQEQVEFLETMMAKRQQKMKGHTATMDDAQNSNTNATSSRYEGLPEHNPSQYILLETTTPSIDASAMNDANTNPSIQVTMLPTPHATVSFSQPKAVNTLSMSEAEQAIQDQRGKITRFMMHDQQRIFQGQAPIHRSRTRLLGKLLPEEDAADVKTGKKKAAGAKRKRLGDEDDDEDDIMGDLAFRNRKGSAKARKELLMSFGDDGMKVDADGVLGGANDAVFGQRGQKFGRFQVDGGGGGDTDKGPRGGDGEDGGGDLEAGGAGGAMAAESTKGNDGLAMADDFYQRDVKAEYDELDYDANEQFDDDDVDVGETEVVIDGSAFNEDDDDDELDDEMGGDRPSGAEGLASLAGFRLMLAKARGEITPEQAADMADRNKRQAEEADKRQAENERKKEDGDSSGDHLAKIMEAAEKARIEAENKMAAGSESGADNNNKAAKKPTYTGVEVDENGQRMITLEAVRREIWLNDGRIPMKRLMKIFDVKKKSTQDRQNKFKEAVRELCTMETDPVGGRMLVLKQHYRRANM